MKEGDTNLFLFEQQLVVYKIPVNSSRPTSEVDMKHKIEIKSVNQMPFMIVDDEPFNNLVLQNQLESIKELNLEFIKASNCKEAVNMFKNRNSIHQKNPIKLIVLDFQMPIMNGLKAGEAIRKFIESGSYHKCSMLLISAPSEEEMTSLIGGSNPFVEYLTKPSTAKQTAYMI